MTKFVDYVFDNIFTDLEVGGKIDTSIARVKSTMKSIEDVIEELEEMKATNFEIIEELNESLEKIVIMNN